MGAKIAKTPRLANKGTIRLTGDRAAVDFAPRLSLPTQGKGLAFSADSQDLYAIDSNALFSFTRGAAERADFPRLDGYADAVAASPTERLVACTSGTTVYLFDGGKLLRSTKLSEDIEAANAVAFSPDGSMFAVGTGHLNSPKTTLEIFSRDGKRLRTLDDDVGFGISHVCFTADSKHVITVRDDSSATSGAFFERWPVEGGAPRRSRIETISGADSLCSARGLVAMGSRAGVALLDEKGRVKWRKKLDTERLAVAPDASVIVAGKGRALRVFSTAGKIVKTITRKSTNAIHSLAISGDGWLALGTDGAIELYRLLETPRAAKRPVAPKAEPGAPKGRPSVTDAWRRIDAYLATHKCRDAPNRGATRAAIAAAEKEVGVSFPEDLVECLTVHDGADWLIGNWSLLGTRNMSKEAASMRKMVDDGAFGDAQGALHPRVKRAWWNVRWIPIVSSGSGHFFCVDMDPAAKGKPGQVILFFHDDEKRLLVADSVREWLGSIAADLDAGKYEYVAESGTWSDEAFLQSSVEGKRTFG